MRLETVLAGLALAGCDGVDDLLGADDHELLAVRIATNQPATADAGVIVDVELVVDNTRRLLAVAVTGGTLQQVGGAAGETTFCVRAPHAGSWIVPIVVKPDGEAMLHVRLLEGIDAMTCVGPQRDARIVPIAARPGAMTIDAGVPDAS